MSNSPLPSRRDRHIAARLEQILAAASRLFAEKGFHRTTTKEIAEAADVSEGTLYNYFENKNDLLFGIMARLAESQDLAAQLETEFPPEARQLFLTMFKNRKAFTEQYTAMQQAILSEILADADLRQRYYQQLIEPITTMLEKQLQMRIMLGQIKPIDAPLTARLIISIWTGLFILQVLGDPLVQSQWDALAEVSTSILFDGVSPRKK